MGKYKVILTLLLALAVLGGYFYLYREKTKFELMVTKQEVQITELKGKIVDQETELNILKTDLETKEKAITALEEKNRKSALASQQTIEDLLELSNISSPNNQGPINLRKEEPNSAAGKEEKKDPGVVDDATSQKLINLRNNIYNRYK